MTAATLPKPYVIWWGYAGSEEEQVNRNDGVCILPYQIISGEEALTRFHLKRATSNFDSWMWDSHLKDSVVLLHEGDLHLSHDLVLDWSGPHSMGAFANKIVRQNQLNWEDGKSLYTFIVDGHLTVDGVVLNADMSDGVLLLVTGGLKARSVVGGGSEIRIKGPTVLSDAAFGHHNDGLLGFEGGLTVPIYLNNDHNMWVEGKEKIEFDFFTFRSGVAEEANLDEGQEEEEDENGDAPLPPSLLARLDPEIEDKAMLCEFLLEGKPVFRSVDWQPEDLSAEQWLYRVQQRWQRLRMVPEALISDAHVDSALSQSGLAIRYVPAAMQTEDRIKAALIKAPEAYWFLDDTKRDDPNAVFAIGCGLYLGQFQTEDITPAMCDAALSYNPGHRVAIPAHLVSPSIVIRLIMQGSHPNSFPNHWQIEKICAELPAYLDDADAVPLERLEQIAAKLPLRLKTPEVLSVLKRRLDRQ